MHIPSTPEIDRLLDEVSPYIVHEAGKEPYISDNAPEGTKEKYAEALRLNKKVLEKVYENLL